MFNVLKINIKLNNTFIVFPISIFFLLFSFYIINQYTYALQNTDYYQYLFGDGSYHISLVERLDKNFSLQKLHPHAYYGNNYYLFSLLILKIIKIFPSYDYSSIGLSMIILNLISIYIVLISAYFISHNITKSKLFSLGVALFIWNQDLIYFSLKIYPDILQLAFIFLAVLSLTISNKNKYFWAIFFSGLAFGVKAQGLLIFLYIIFFYLVYELFSDNFKFSSKNDVESLVCYLILFFFLFFILNLQNPLKFFWNILESLISKSHSELEFHNFRNVNLYFSYIFQGNYLFKLFILFISVGCFFVYKYKFEYILFFFTILTIIIFYIQVINLKSLVEGPRYLWHFIPLLIIVFSVSFKNIKEFFNIKKLNVLVNLLTFTLLFCSYLLFIKNFSASLQRFDFKNILENDNMIKGSKFFTQIDKRKQNPFVCAGYYSVVPESFSNRVAKHYQHLELENQIKGKICDYIVLDDSTPGRYIWFEESIDNLKIANYKNLSEAVQSYGEQNIKKTQDLIQYILLNQNSGYNVIFYNNKIIILEKSNI
jgi:hypothetical protein